jgi:hypothetical protein
LAATGLFIPKDKTMSTQQTAGERELLELAAQAYWAKEIADGEISFRYDEAEAAIVYIHADNQDHNGEDRERVWNPLTDDGDALRLAVKLGMQVGPNAASREPTVFAWARERGMTAEYGIAGGDALAATRRTIVRAAAAIARATTQQEQA